MSYRQLIIILVLVCSLVLNFVFQSIEASLVFIAASCLFCFDNYLESKKYDDALAFKKELRDLKERIDKLSFKNLGR